MRDTSRPPGTLSPPRLCIGSFSAPGSAALAPAVRSAELQLRATANAPVPRRAGALRSNRWRFGSLRARFIGG